MRSRTTRRFRESFQELAAEIQESARAAYKLFQDDPHHPSLRFKQVHTAAGGIYSVRVDVDHRALGVLDGETIVWFWIGSHDQYERLLKKL